MEYTFPDRVQKMTKILNDIIKKSDEELVQMLQEMEETLIHNFDVFMENENEYFYKTFESIKF
jgi:hypothetical protein